MTAPYLIMPVIPVSASVPAVPPALGVAPAFVPPFLPGPAIVIHGEPPKGELHPPMSDNYIKVQITPSPQGDKVDAVPHTSDEEGFDYIDVLQAQIDRLVEAGLIKDTQDEKKLDRKSAGYPYQRPPPTSGDGSEFKAGPRTGAEADAKAWPFGEGKDDIDPKWGRTRDKLKDKKVPCGWM